MNPCLLVPFLYQCEFFLQLYKANTEIVSLFVCQSFLKKKISVGTAAERNCPRTQGQTSLQEIIYFRVFFRTCSFLSRPASPHSPRENQQTPRVNILSSMSADSKQIYAHVYGYGYDRDSCRHRRRRNQFFFFILCRHFFFY